MEPAGLTLEELRAAVQYYESKVNDLAVEYRLSFGRYEGQYPHGEMIENPGGAYRRWVAKGPAGGPVFLDDMCNVAVPTPAGLKAGGWLHQVFAFDGVRSRYTYRSTKVDDPATAKPPEAPGFYGHQGHIYEGIHRKLIPLRDFATPELYSLRFFTPIRFSEALATRHAKVLGSEVRQGVKCVVVEVRGLKPLEEMDISPLIVRLWLDPGRGFSPLRIARTTFSGMKFGLATEIEIQEVAPEVWFPKRALWLTYANSDRGRRVDDFLAYEATKIEANRDIPEEFFALRFRAGLSVRDHIVGVKYFAGPPVHDLDVSVKATTEDARRVLDYYEVTSGGTTFGTGITLLGVGTVLGAAAVVALWTIRKRRKLPRALILLCIAPICNGFRTPQALGSATSNRESVKSCGTNSLLLAMSWLGLDVSAKEVLAQIEPAEDGTTDLSRLAKVARAHGLRARPFRSISLRSLRAHLGDCRAACIMYLKAGRRGHFVPCVRVVEDRLLLLDLDRGARFVPWPNIRPVFQAGGSSALFVSRESHTMRGAKSIASPVGMLAGGSVVGATVSVLVLWLSVRRSRRHKHLACPYRGRSDLRLQARAGTPQGRAPSLSVPLCGRRL